VASNLFRDFERQSLLATISHGQTSECNRYLISVAALCAVIFGKAVDMFDYSKYHKPYRIDSFTWKNEWWLSIDLAPCARFYDFDLWSHLDCDFRWVSNRNGWKSNLVAFLNKLIALNDSTLKMIVHRLKSDHQYFVWWLAAIFAAGSNQFKVSQ